MSKIAIILGATGLTGEILLQRLLNDDRYSKIKLFSRNSVANSHPKIEEYLIDLLKLEKYSACFTGDEVFCCIGTTASKTPDKKLYREIDYGIPVAAAHLCLQNNIKTIVIISALGANAKSNISYNKIKGEMEDTILSLAIDKTHFLQPSLIGGTRSEKRMGEYLFKQFMKIVNPLLVASLKKYRSIHPDTIVYAMIWIANNKYYNEKVISDEIKEIARNS
ncbi:oxidoreductase [Aquimarina addita]|uniref:Oxidoreductase n=1 Tax=Aquimarina addita TaxID=870485 RepID=A0ABP7XC38_9FLAO